MPGWCWLQAQSSTDGMACAKAQSQEKAMFSEETERDSESWMECEGYEAQGETVLERKVGKVTHGRYAGCTPHSCFLI